MKVKVLASGSKGNSTYIETDKIKLLIDIGVSFPYLSRELEKISVTPNEINGILITHVHSDHIKGLQALVKKTGLKVYVKEEMIPKISEKIPIENLEVLSEKNNLENLLVQCIPTSHDVVSMGFLIQDKQSSLVYITDTGYINQKNLKKIVNKDIYIIESNHDENMLMNGPYPYVIKQRIIGDKGHLSNTTVANYLTNLVGEKTKYIILAHLSEQNNTEELAYQTTKQILQKKHIEKPILIAKPYESLELVEV